MKASSPPGGISGKSASRNGGGRPRTAVTVVTTDSHERGISCPNYPKRPGCGCRHCSGKCLCVRNRMQVRG